MSYIQFWFEESPAAWKELKEKALIFFSNKSDVDYFACSLYNEFKDFPQTNKAIDYKPINGNLQELYVKLVMYDLHHEIAEAILKRSLELMKVFIYFKLKDFLY